MNRNFLLLEYGRLLFLTGLCLFLLLSLLLLQLLLEQLFFFFVFKWIAATIKSSLILWIILERLVHLLSHLQQSISRILDVNDIWQFLIFQSSFDSLPCLGLRVDLHCHQIEHLVDVLEHLASSLLKRYVVRWVPIASSLDLFNSSLEVVFLHLHHQRLLSVQIQIQSLDVGHVPHCLFLIAPFQNLLLLQLSQPPLLKLLRFRDLQWKLSWEFQSMRLLLSGQFDLFDIECFMDHYSGGVLAAAARLIVHHLLQALHRVAFQIDASQRFFLFLVGQRAGNLHYDFCCGLLACLLGLTASDIDASIRCVSFVQHLLAKAIGCVSISAWNESTLLQTCRRGRGQRRCVLVEDDAMRRQLINIVNLHGCMQTKYDKLLIIFSIIIITTSSVFSLNITRHPFQKL